MIPFLELGLVLLGLGATVYFAWPELRGALRFATGRWALALMLPFLAASLGAGVVIDQAKAGMHPERIGSAQLVLIISMLGFGFSMLVFVVVAVHESYGGFGRAPLSRRRSGEAKELPPDVVPGTLPESPLPGHDAHQPAKAPTGHRVGGLLLLFGAMVPWSNGVVTLAAQAPAAFSDAHVHLNSVAPWVAMMESSGIDRAIIFRGRDIDNAGLLAAARQHPEKLIPFLSVSPEHQEYRARWESGDLSLVALADSLLAGGEFRGIGEISVSHFPGAGFPEADFDPNGPIMRGLLEVARRHRVPVTMHLEITRLREFESLLEAYPGVTVIWAHGGYTPVFLAERLLARYPNLVYELSARTWPEHPRSADYTILRDGQAVWPQWLELVERLPERFLVGTDAALRSASGDQARIASVHNFLGQLSPPARVLVASGNLDRILGRGR